MSAAATRLDGLLDATQVAELPLGPGADSIPMALPSSEEQAIELVELANRDRLRILPLGAGTKLGWSLGPISPAAAPRSAVVATGFGKW